MLNFEASNLQSSSFKGSLFVTNDTNGSFLLVKPILPFPSYTPLQKSFIEYGTIGTVPIVFLFLRGIP